LERDHQHRRHNGYDCRNVKSNYVHAGSSRVQLAHVGGRFFALSLALLFAADPHARHAPEVVIRVFAGSADQQIFFFVNQVLPLVLAHFKVGCELDGVSRAGVLAVAAEDAAGKVDAEELRVAPAGGVLRGLQRDAIHRAGDSAQITGDAALASLGIAGKDNTSAPAWRKIRRLLRILPGNTRPKAMQKNIPKCSNDTEHIVHLAPSGKNASTTAPVTSRLARASGSISFQAQAIS